MGLVGLVALAGACDPAKKEPAAVEAWGAAWRDVRACYLGETPASDDLQLATVLRTLPSAEPALLLECEAKVKALTRSTDHSGDTAIEAGWYEVDKGTRRLLALGEVANGGASFSARVSAVRRLGSHIGMLDDAYQDLRSRVGLPSDALAKGPRLTGLPTRFVTGDDGEALTAESIEVRDGRVLLHQRDAITVMTGPTQRHELAVADLIDAATADGEMIMFALRDGKRMLRVQNAGLDIKDADGTSAFADALAVQRSTNDGKTWAKPTFFVAAAGNTPIFDWLDQRADMVFSDGTSTFWLPLDQTSLSGKLTPIAAPPSLLDAAYCPASGGASWWWGSDALVRLDPSTRTVSPIFNFAQAGGTATCDASRFVSLARDTRTVCTADGCETRPSLTNLDPNGRTRLTLAGDTLVTAKLLGGVLVIELVDLAAGTESYLALGADTKDELVGLVTWDGVAHAVVRQGERVMIAKIPLDGARPLTATL